MPWGRLLLALLMTALVVTGVGFAAAQLTGLYRIDLPSAAGLNQADAAALSQPFTDLSTGADALLLARVSAESNRQQAAQQIDQMQALLPRGAPTSSRLLGWRVTRSSNGNFLSGVHEYQYPEHVARVETALARASDTEPWRVDGFHLNVASRAELAENRFTLAGKPPSFLGVVVGTIVNPVFMLVTFLTALFSRSVKVRWLWLIATMVGVGTFSMNGASGEWAFNPVSVQLFGASATWSGSAFDPWMFGVSLPLGALAFWLTRPFAKRSVAPAGA
jgi:hypothetical protein